jgi:hypothetical protein
VRLVFDANGGDGGAAGASRGGSPAANGAVDAAANGSAPRETDFNDATSPADSDA